MAGRQERQNQAARQAAAARGSASDPDLSGGTGDPDLSGAPIAAERTPAAPERPGRSASDAAATAGTARGESDAHVVPTAGKGRPTPKRREAEARNRRPVVVTDRKEAKKRARAEREVAFKRQQEGIAAGDERFFMPRDRGKARRFARDFVDARWCVGELMLPVAVVVLILLLFQSLAPQLITYAVLGTYSLLLLALVDGIIVAFQVKRRLAQKFDADEIPRWTGLYATMRSLQLRRLRQPKARVARGQKIA